VVFELHRNKEMVDQAASDGLRVTARSRSFAVSSREDLGMHIRSVFATVLVLVWAVSADAQYREPEHGHGRYRERERVVRPAFIPPAPRRMWFDERPVLYPARIGRDPDAPICDNPDRDPDAAIEACGRIIARGQTRYGYSLPVAFTHRGQAYENKSDLDHAIADFSEAILLKPRVSGYFAMRGVAWEKSGNVDGAQSDFREAAGLDPKNQDALNGLNRIETRSVSAEGATPATPLAAPVAQPPSTAIIPAVSHPPIAPSAP
jgi:tetratricopeptide (TPR) repeat protein